MNRETLALSSRQNSLIFSAVRDAIPSIFGAQMTRPLVIFIDVDDTFVRSFGSKRIPMTSSIDRIKKLHGEGAELYCWSSGGSLYAQQSAAEFGIEECFTAFLPKPNIVIDDVKLRQWHELAELHPNQVASTSRVDLEKLLGR